MKALLTNAITHWKSTASGILTCLLVATGATLTIPAVQAHATTVSIILAIQAAGKIYISMLQMDAGTTTAIFPGNPIPEAVPSHEVPDNPAAKAAKPEAQ